MDNEDTEKSRLDWRIMFGLTITTVWMGTGIYYITRLVGWTEFQRLPTADIGSFFEGAFAPLAFLWLVIGHFMQQKEITANTRATSLQEQSTRRLELHSRRDSYFKLLGLVQEQLGSIAGFHYISIYGPTGTDEVSLEKFSQLRSEASTGDHSLFIRLMVSEAANNRDNPEVLRDMLFGTDIRTRHSENFKRTFGRVLEAAESVDTDNMLCEALLDGSAAGLYYRIIRHVAGEEEMNPISGLRTTNL
ncbi:hypothetical protein [Congregibacter litoralis]|uniref:Uncharacterized protein n=1 Tax=Congregibacter litoralis KT71 TaxID=314285 RepID=A4A3Q7_9GAMM|nr:hypothetical protein [Congregibacter litoralis]EAQ99330.1 hypothetical protein KT71_16711 [Congregibacter litoralis KT71]